MRDMSVDILASTHGRGGYAREYDLCVQSGNWAYALDIRTNGAVLAQSIIDIHGDRYWRIHAREYTDQ
jgi:hypothetical protein